MLKNKWNKSIKLNDIDKKKVRLHKIYFRIIFQPFTTNNQLITKHYKI